MHLIKSNIPTDRIEDIKAGLVALGVVRLRFADIKGYIEGRETEIAWRGCRSIWNLLPECELEALVCNESVDNAVNLILKTIGNGSGGDGFVCVTPVEECYRIRTGHPQF